MSSIKKDLKHIHKNHLSDRIQNAIDKNGFSIYKGVLIVWSDARDEFLIEMIDDLVQEYPDQLLVVHFDDKLLEMLWKDDIPSKFQDAVINFENIRMELQSSAWMIPVFFNIKFP
jgi:hypothetical protein